jgi:serine/threonine protein kinase
LTGQKGEPDDADPRAWAPEPTAGQMRLPGYSGFTKIAEGGESVVYRARQNGLDRDVAVKVINVADPERVARFRRELEITVRLGRQHPHIVTVLDTGTAPDGRPCIVMEYYDLGSLHDRLREYGPLPVADVVAAGIAVADALAFAHGQGFLHRDVKPQNILMLPTSFVLADFGIARMAGTGHSASLQLVSYRHAAPQMIDGQPPAAADDIYSLGSTLFTLLAGMAPYAADNPAEDTVLSYLGRLHAAETRPLNRPDAPPELLDVIFTCLRKDRADRYPDAAMVRSALGAVPADTLPWIPLLPLDVGGDDSDGGGDGGGDLTTQLTDEETVVPDFGPRPDHAGFAPPAEIPPEPQVIPAPEEPPPPPRNRGLVYGLIALVISVAAAVTLVVLNGPPAATPAPGPATVPTTPALPTSDIGAAPSITTFDDRGTSVRIAWTDPSGGRTPFVVNDVTGPTPRAVDTVAAGTTTYIVDGLDRTTAQYCYQIVAIGVDGPTSRRGASDRVCTQR